MEKDYRLYVRNLPLNINEDKVKELFDKYVSVKKVDLKEKKDLTDKINKFAFINISTTAKELHSCFSELNGERIDGFEISVELAKESFLERLKRERNENNHVKSNSNDLHSFDKSNTFDSPNLISKGKRKTFCDEDFIANDVHTENVKSTDYRTDILEFSGHDEEKPAENLDYSTEEQSDWKNLNISNKSKKKVFDLDYSSIIKSKNEKEVKISKNKEFKHPTKGKNKSNKSNIHEKIEVCESEKKRLMSLKQKKQAFKAQEQTIRDALRFIDNKKSNNKIVFDDNMDFQNEEVKSQSKKVSTKNNNLFASDDEAEGEEKEQFEWNEDELEAKASLKKKLGKLQTNIGNDKRFTLDERFIDEKDEDQKDFEQKEDQSEVDEKNWQLSILGDVLGKSITKPTTDENQNLKKKNRMIRYDPTANNHKDYEVTVTKSAEEKPVKKKKKLTISEEKVDIPIPTSKEVFYDVSSTLVDSLKQSEGFSLLKAFGRNDTNADKHGNNQHSDTAKEEGNFKFDFSSKNPFKYDSSDDEDGNENEAKSSNVIEFTMPKSRDNRLFFSNNDERFNEAESFFKNSSTQEDTFKDRRRELKVIVRSKIRNNLKKAIPWNKRKVRKEQKKKFNK